MRSILNLSYAVSTQVYSKKVAAVYRLQFTSIFAIAIFLSFGNATNGQGVTDPPANPTGAPAAESSLGDEQAKKEILASVYSELAEMVPGDVASGSETEKVLQDAISLFANRKPKEAKQRLQDYAAKNKNFPPVDLMTATLAYAINDAPSGKLLLEQAAVKNPDYPDIYFSFGQLALSQRRLTDADAQAEMALQKITGSTTFDQVQLNHFKERYYKIKYSTAKARGQWDKARGFVKELEAVSPQSTQTIVAKAELAFEDGDTDQATSLLRQLNNKPNIGKLGPELTIANWFQRKGKLETANLWVRKASAAHEDDADTQTAAARWAIARENFPESLAYVKKIEAISGKTPVVKELRGKVAFAQGAYATAKSNFEGLLADNPNNINAANMLALSMVQDTDEESQAKALNLAKQVATAQPNNAITLSSLAYVLLKTGETETARSIMSKVAQRPNPNAEVTFVMAYMLTETGQLPQAKALLENALKAKGLFLFRGEAKKLLAQVEQSSQDLPERNE